jgi:hypothetical protein
MTVLALKTLVVLCAFLLAGLVPSASAERDESGIVAYPGGDYGIDIGGGYGIMPDGTMLEPEQYRDSYRDTKYGPMTQTGFVNFPSFSFPDAVAPSEPETEEKIKPEEFIFYQDPASSAGSSIWGVSAPRKHEK